MTKYEFFEAGYGLIAARLGLLSPYILAKYDVYKTYLENLEKFKSLPEYKAGGEAKKLTQIQCSCGYYTVTRSINFFEEGKVLQISVNGQGK